METIAIKKKQLESELDKMNRGQELNFIQKDKAMEILKERRKFCNDYAYDIIGRSLTDAEFMNFQDKWEEGESGYSIKEFIEKEVMPRGNEKGTD